MKKISIKQFKSFYSIFSHFHYRWSWQDQNIFILDHDLFGAVACQREARETYVAIQIQIEYFLNWSSLSVDYLQGRLLLQMRLKYSSGMRQLKTFCQTCVCTPKIASKVQSLLWEVGQTFIGSQTAGERLNPLLGFIRCPSLTLEHPSKKSLKFHLLKYNFIFLKLFISPEKLDSLF